MSGEQISLPLTACSTVILYHYCDWSEAKSQRSCDLYFPLMAKDVE